MYIIEHLSNQFKGVCRTAFIVFCLNIAMATLFPMTAIAQNIDPSATAKSPNLEVVTRYVFRDSGEWAAELRVETIYRASDAARWRRYFAQAGVQSRGQEMHAWYAERFKGIESLTPFSVTDTPDRSALRTSEHYGLSAAALQPHLEKFWLNPYAVAPNFGALPDEKMARPHGLPAAYQTHRIELIGVDGLEVLPASTSQNDFLRYRQVGSALADGIAVDFEIELLVDEVTPEQANAYVAAIKEREEAYRPWFRLVHPDKAVAKSAAYEELQSGLVFWSIWTLMCLAGLVLLRLRRHRSLP